MYSYTSMNSGIPCYCLLLLSLATCLLASQQPPKICRVVGQDLAANLAPTTADNTAQAPPLEGSLYIIYGDGDLDFENNLHAFLGSPQDIGDPVKLLDLNGDQHLDIVHAYSRQVNTDTRMMVLQTYLNSSTTLTCFTNVSTHLLPDLALQTWEHLQSKMGIHPIRDIQVSDANQDGTLDLWIQLSLMPRRVIIC